MPKQANIIMQSDPGLQRGSALIIALVFLLIMTLLGTTAMQSTSQQEKMAGDMRDRSLAFQAASAALRAGERNVLNVPLIAFQALNTGDSWTAYFQGNTSFFLNGTMTAPTAPNVWALTSVSTQPSYVIENMNNNDVACLSNASLNCYRITAFGVGGSPNAVVILQSMFYL